MLLEMPSHRAWAKHTAHHIAMDHASCEHASGAGLCFMPACFQCWPMFHASMLLVTAYALCPHALGAAEYERQVAQHRASDTLVARQLAVPDAERIARKKKRRRRRWERQQRALAGQPVRVLEGYSAVPSHVAMLAPSFASKTGTDSYDDESDDFLLDEESSSGGSPFQEMHNASQACMLVERQLTRS